MVDDRHSKISQKAYELWESHGKPHGKSTEHWAAATKAVDSAHEKPAKTTRGRAAKVAKEPEMETVAPEAPMKKPRTKAVKAVAHVPESAKAEPAKTETERHVEKPVEAAAKPKPSKAAAAAEPEVVAEKKPRRAKKV